MGAKLFDFIYKTVQRTANDPGSKSWLPRRLAALPGPGGQGKRLPLREKDWDLGALQGNAGTTFRTTISGLWWLLKGEEPEYKDDPELEKRQPIACPKSPWPLLGMPEIEIAGLDNVLLLAPPLVEQSPAGYRVAIPFQAGYYRGQGGLPKLDPITLTGKYRLQQCVCSAPDKGPNECDGYVPDEEIVGTGTFRATLTNVIVDVTLRVEVAGVAAGRKLDAIVEKIAMRGGSKGQLPTLKIDDLKLDTDNGFRDDWLSAARDALESADGMQGLLSNVNAALGSKDVLDQASSSITDQLSKLIDDALSPVVPGRLPGSGLPRPGENPCDLYLFDRVRAAVDDPSSPYYLPRVVADSESPLLDPYRIDEIPLPDQRRADIDFKEVKLTGVSVTGVSNVRSPSDRIAFLDQAIDATLLLSTLDPPPRVSVIRNGQPCSVEVPGPPLVITGQFSLRVDEEDEPLGGAFVLRMDGATVRMKVRFGGEQLDQLSIAFDALVLDAPLAGTKIAIKIASDFKDVINRLLDQGPIKQAVMDAVNGEVKKNLAAIGAAATAQVKRLVAPKLQGAPLGSGTTVAADALTVGPSELLMVEQLALEGLGPSGSPRPVNLGCCGPRIAAPRAADASAVVEDARAAPSEAELLWNDESHWKAIEMAVAAMKNMANPTPEAKAFVALWDPQPELRQRIKDGLRDADYVDEWVGPFILGLFTSYAQHFYDPDTGNNYMGFGASAVTTGARTFEQSVRLFRQGKQTEAAYRLGLSLHFLTDLTQPMHAANFPNIFGESYPIPRVQLSDPKNPAVEINDLRHSGFEDYAERRVAELLKDPPALAPADLSTAGITSAAAYLHETAVDAKRVWTDSLRGLAGRKLVRWVSIGLIPVPLFNNYWEGEASPALDLSLRLAPKRVARFLAYWMMRVMAPRGPGDDCAVTTAASCM